MRISERLQLGKLATPLLDRRRPVYRWFQIKESFSSGIVRLLAETWGLAEGDRVLDPFCGAGTTLLACKELGLDCVGFDVHPLFLLASRVKVRNYEVGEMHAAAVELMSTRPERQEVDVPGFVSRVFLPKVLSEVSFFRRKILEIEDDGVKEFLLLGLINAAMECSWARKDGAAIKVVKGPVRPLGKTLERKLLEMCGDIEQLEVKGSKVEVERCDARKLGLGDKSVSAVITSPPYLAKREYVHVYRIEQWIAGLEGPIPEELAGGEETESAGTLAERYFKDVSAAIGEIYRVCGPGARVCLVVSDGCFPDGPVEVCVRLSEIAEEAGFKAKQVVVVNRRQCTTPARRKVGVAKEALLMWEKRP